MIFKGYRFSQFSGVFCLCICLGLLALSMPAYAQSGEPHWQLFLDDYIVARSTGFDRVLHHPMPKGIVIPADKPWETGGLAPIYIGKQNDGTFVAYYTAFWWDIDSVKDISDRPHQLLTDIGYAVSKDGLHWEKPALNLRETPAGVDRVKHAPFPSPNGKTTKKNNLGVPFSVIADLGLYGNVLDPQKRFVIKVFGADSGAADVFSREKQAAGLYYAKELPNFVKDRKWSEKLTPFKGTLSPRGGTVNYWDDINKEWVALAQGVVPHWLPSREIGRFASKDFETWTSTSVFYPDTADRHDLEYYEEAYNLAPYYAEGVVLGLLMWFKGDRTNPDGGPTLTPTSEHPNTWPWVRKGSLEVRLTMSRDGGNTWDRTVSREAWIANGEEPESHDHSVIAIPPVRVGDEDWFYASVINQDHLNTRNNPGQTAYHHSGPAVRHIALYTQKHNRYACMRARSQQSILITKPVEVTGNQLQLNVNADRGEVRVGIALAEPVSTYNGKAMSTSPHLYENTMLPGFTFEDCTPIYANSIEHTVTFKNGANLESLKGKKAIFLFQMTDADLYGFRIK